MLLFGALAKGINNLPKKYFCTFLVKLPATPSRFSVNKFLFPAYSISVLTASGSSKIIKPLSTASCSVAPFILEIRAAFIASS